MLVEMLQHKRYELDSLERQVGVSVLDNRTGNNDNVISLLYQSGYLSVDSVSEDGQIYKLKFPNEEVRSGFFQFLLPFYADVQGGDTASELEKFLDDVRNGRVEQFLQRLTSLFAGFQYDAQKDSYTEEHFRNVLYVLCTLLGLKVKAEYMTSDGRIDLLITTDKFRYVVECKIDSTSGVALKQIHDKEYGLSWTLDEKETMLIGLNFSTEKRRPDDWVVERGDGSIVSSSTQHSTQDDTERGQARGQARGQVPRLILAIEHATLSRQEIMDILRLRSRDKFISNYLKPALADEYIAMSIPETPNDPNQAYYLTTKGLRKLSELKYE